MDKFAVDWLSFTISGSHASSVGLGSLFSSLLPGVAFSSRDRGFLNYTSSASFLDTGIVAWGGEFQKGTVHFYLPSSCIASIPDFDAFLMRVYSLCVSGACKCTRLDFSFDDRESGLLSFPVILDAVRCGDFRALCKRDKIVYSCSLFEDDNKLIAQKITFGSRSSFNYVRIYDKQQEQGTDYHWIRVELECKNDRASFNFLRFCASGLSPSSAVECLRYALDFVDSSSDSNISRCPSLAWWDLFLFQTARVKLSLPAKPSSFLRRVLWFSRLSRSIASLMLVMGEDFFASLASQGLDSLSDSDYEAVCQAMEQGWCCEWLHLPSPGVVALPSSADDFAPLPDVFFDDGKDYSFGFFAVGGYGASYNGSPDWVGVI